MPRSAPFIANSAGRTGASLHTARADGNEGRRRGMGARIAIVGAGAVGGYAGAHMVQAGEDVTFIDPWPAHVDHMRKHGLRVTHAKDVPEFRVPVRALHVTDVQHIAKEKPFDIAFVCMKSYDTA